MKPLRCECGLASCRTCYQREYTRKRRERLAAQPIAAATPAATLATPVNWSADLSALRAHAGAGACVGVFAGGRVFVDRVFGERLEFDSLSAALDHFTAPSLAG